MDSFYTALKKGRAEDWKVANKKVMKSEETLPYSSFLCSWIHQLWALIDNTRLYSMNSWNDANELL